MNFAERVKMVARNNGTTISALEKEFGLGNAYFANVKKLSARASSLLSAKYPDLNMEWVATGKGSMYSNGVNPEGALVPLLPVSMQGGSLNDFELQVEEYECDKITSPVASAQIAAPVSGDSMSPEYPSGCIVFLRRIDETAFIEWGRTYALDTVNGSVIKNVFPSAKDSECITCRSVNPNYADFDIRKSDIRAWYRVVGSYSQK